MIRNTTENSWLIEHLEAACADHLFGGGMNRENVDVTGQCIRSEILLRPRDNDDAYRYARDIGSEIYYRNGENTVVTSWIYEGNLSSRVIKISHKPPRSSRHNEDDDIIVYFVPLIYGESRIKLHGHLITNMKKVTHLLDKNNDFFTMVYRLRRTREAMRMRICRRLVISRTRNAQAYVEYTEDNAQVPYVMIKAISSCRATRYLKDYLRPKMRLSKNAEEIRVKHRAIVEALGQRGCYVGMDRNNQRVVFR